MILPDLSDVRTAYHEAGHAVVAKAYGFDVERVSIEPGAESFGHTVTIPFAMIAFGGMAAELLIFPGQNAPEAAALVSEGGASDWNIAREQVTDALRQIGRDADAEAVEHTAWLLFDQVIACLEQNLPALHAVAASLIEHRAIDGEQLERIVTRAGILLDARVRRTA